MTVALAAVLAGCSVSTGGLRGTGSEPSSSVAAGARVAFRFDGRVATATLADTPQARQFVAMLPATVDLKDVWGQTKSGRLPHPLTVEGAVPVHDPVPGDIYFWPQTDVIAVYYDDLDQRVPGLGVVDTGLNDLAGAGRRITVRIELTAETSS
jgi:hypothetical protein